MGKLMLPALLLIAAPVSAENAFQGQWEVRDPRAPAYVGAVLIDCDGRATWDSPRDRGRPAKFLGYVKDTDASKMLVIFTDRKVVVHMHCTIQSSELLHCYNTHNGTPISPGFVLARVGPGPRRLTRAPQ